MMRGFPGFGGVGNMGVFGWIGMILNIVLTIGVIVGFIILVVWAVRRISRSSAVANVQPSMVQSPKDIASARYARGEITREEYQQILTDLGHG